jgi:BirA family biotin operon repressor/biotin-[acetyl-CoA-carboxylase] ligase
MRIGETFIQLIEVESTNNYAMGQVQAHLAGHGSAWFANTQTAGKGQRGKAWLSEPGENIILSCAIDPKPLTFNRAFILSMAVALGSHDFFSGVAGDEAKIKWPNDIYWKDRKAGGILIENILRGQEWKYAIAGIGLNINQVNFPPDLPNPVSLRQVTGKKFDAASLARELCTCLDNRWQQVVTGDTTNMLNEYCQRLYKLNEVVTFKKVNAVFTAKIIGVNERGELLVKTGEQTSIPFGEVEWVLSK